MSEKLEFRNSENKKLIGILNSNNSKKIVILGHGIYSSKDSLTYELLEKYLVEAGLASFRFDLSGHGESEGTQEEITLSNNIDDMNSAIKFIKEKGFEKIGLLGVSWSGEVDLIVASKSKDVCALGLRCPETDYYNGLKFKLENNLAEYDSSKEKIIITARTSGKKRIIKKENYEDAKLYNIFEIAPNINLPVLIIQGDKDLSSPVENSEKVHSLLPKSELIIIKGADHKFTGFIEESMKPFRDFFLKYL